jgi:hypothetical protein
VNERSLGTLRHLRGGCAAKAPPHWCWCGGRSVNISWWWRIAVIAARWHSRLILSVRARTSRYIINTEEQGRTMRSQRKQVMALRAERRSCLLCDLIVLPYSSVLNHSRYGPHERRTGGENAGTGDGEGPKGHEGEGGAFSRFPRLPWAEKSLPRFWRFFLGFGDRSCAITASVAAQRPQAASRDRRSAPSIPGCNSQSRRSDPSRHAR